MILNDSALRQRAVEGLVSPLTLSNIQGSSIDLTLGSTIKVENLEGVGWDMWRDVDITQPYRLAPGEFILAHTAETISIPEDCSGMVLLRSSAARAGYEHSLAGWCDPSFKGQITLELRNNCRYHYLPVECGMRLCQLVVHKLVNVPDQPYDIRGNYQGQMGVTESNYNFSEVA